MLDPTDPQNNTSYILTEELLQNPFYIRFFHAWVGLFAVCQIHYFGWKNAEGAQNIWHAGFEGYDDKGNEIGGKLQTTWTLSLFRQLQIPQSCLEVGIKRLWHGCRNMCICAIVEVWGLFIPQVYSSMVFTLVTIFSFFLCLFQHSVIKW